MLSIFPGTGGNQVSRQVVMNELIEGKIAVERTDDPVPITPGVREQDIPALTIGIGVASHIHPMPPPTFPEERGGEGLIHFFFNREIGIPGGEVDECLDFIGVGRKADEIKREASEKGVWVGVWARRQMTSLEPCENKMVQRFPGSVRLLDRGDSWLPEGL